MPISDPRHLPIVLHYGCSLRPLSILEIGVGMGAYGFMFRQYLDIASERIKRSDWKVTIHGVEIFSPYKNPIWEYAYDNIIIGDIRDQLPHLGHYDLCICADVIEHFKEDDAIDLSVQLNRMADCVIYTTPSGVYPQGAWGGNEFETHHSLITPKSLTNVVAVTKAVDTTCIVCCNTKQAASVIRKARVTAPVVRNSWKIQITSFARSYVNRVYQFIIRTLALKQL